MNNTNNFNKIENTIMIEELNKELSTYSYTTSDNTCLEYFVGYEIAVILGYKNTTQVIQYISKSNQLQFQPPKFQIQCFFCISRNNEFYSTNLTINRNFLTF